MKICNVGVDVKQPRLQIPGSLSTYLATGTSNATSMNTHRYFFSNEDIQGALYSCNEVKPINLSEVSNKSGFFAEEQVHFCESCNKKDSTECPHQGPLRKRRRSSESSKKSMPRSVETCPNEVQLCTSSIPGARIGLCAKQHIPTGTWIGPYEGTRLRPDEVNSAMDTTYLWEIYHKGQLAGYINGSDENNSSWMRYIQCARHREEQNLFVFQYLGNVYYRAFKDISQGTELLVWYDEIYPQYMGIPLSIHDMADVNIEDHNSPRADAVSMTTSCNHTDYQVQESEHYAEVSNESKSSEIYKSRTFHSGRNNVVPPSRIRRGSHRPESMFNLPNKTTSTTTTTVDSVQTNMSTTTNASSPDSTRDPTSEIQQDQLEDSLTAGRSPSSPEGLEIGLWKCGQCGKMFAQRTLLQVHICPCAPKKPYQCGHCPESFSQPNDLRNHVAIHTGEKPFKCGYCSRSFSGATTLNNHIRMHTGEKPFVCERCGKTFSQGSQLSKHHKIPGDCI